MWSDNMTTFSEFSKSKKQATFSTFKKDAVIYQFEHHFLSDYLSICIFSNTTNKLLKHVIVRKEVIAGVKSFTALVNAIKDDSLNHNIADLHDAYLQNQKQDTQDNKTLAKGECNSPLTGLPVCHPSTSPLLGRGGSFLHNELNKGKKCHGNNNGLQKVHGFPTGSSPSHFLVTKNHGNKNSKTKHQQQCKFLERFYHSSL